MAGKTTDANATESDTTDTGTPPAPVPEPGTGADKAAKVEFTAEQQAHIDKIIGERLVRAQAKWAADATAADAKAESDAEQKRLEEQAEWQKLADQRQARIIELEPLEATTKADAELFEGMLESKLKTLGDKAKTAIESLTGSPGAREKLQWLTANEALFATKPPPDVDAHARGDGTTGEEVTDEQVNEFAVRMGVNPKHVDRKRLAQIIKLGG